MSDTAKKISCGTHGQVVAAFICCHLLQDDKAPLGFNEAELEEGDLEQQAWCDACEALVERDGEWTDENIQFADIKLVCEFCFANLRQIHDHTLLG